MKLRLLMALVLVLGFCAAPAMAQTDPFGTLDTIEIVASVVPDPGAGQYTLQLDLYVYSDEPLVGATVGFVWDNPKVVMDTAITTAEINTGFDLGRFVYENNSRSVTNANRRFLFGGASLFGSLPGSTTRRLWASYIFSTPGWTESDAVTFDSLTYSGGTEYLFVEGNIQGEVKPYFKGKVTVGNATPPNNPPVLTAIGPKSVNEMALLNFTVTATDPDAGDVLTLSATNLPAGASFTPATGAFSWTPTYEQAGVYNVTFSVTDGEATDEEIVAITVNNVNRAPILATIGPKSVDENALLSFTVTASDPDGTVPTLSAANLPVGASFTPATGLFTWTPTYDQAGVVNVTFAATDGALTDDEIVAITVNNVNRPPVVDPIDDATACVGAELTLAAMGSDPDGPLANMWLDPVLPNMTAIFDGTGQLAISFTPTLDQLGSYPLTVYATDNEDTVSVEFSMSVIDCSANDSGKIAIWPMQLYFFMQDAVEPMKVTITVGEFVGGHVAGDVDPTSVIVNDTVAPVEVTVEPSYVNFEGEVLSIDVWVTDLLVPYGAFYDTVIAPIQVVGSFGDGSVFSTSMSIKLIGHRSGDANLDGDIDIADVVAILDTMFRGKSAPGGMAGADVDGHCGVTIGDVVYYVAFLFRGGADLQPPCGQ